jgi:predicted Rossmann fold flavoprotein
MPELLNLAETGQQDFLVFDRVDGACKLTGGAIAAALFDLVQDPVEFKKLGSILRIELHGAKVAIFSVRRCRIACIFVVLMPSEQPRKRLLAIIGGGAAGFFAAITAARQDPSAQVVILDKSSRVLAKVRISGGGRCNVTHACFDPALLTGFYPRGGKELRQVFSRFQPRDTVSWFEREGVRLKTEDDGRMFPDTDQSETIVRCLEEAAQHAGVVVRKQSAVLAINPDPNGGMVLQLADGSLRADKVLVASGGMPSASGFAWLKDVGHAIQDPVPSLFTFNLPQDPLTGLPGLVVDPAEVKLIGTKFKETGPVLVTHWGLSGPAILRLSARAARELAAVHYRQEILINWLPGQNEQQLREIFSANRHQFGTRMLRSHTFEGLPKRMWEYLLVCCEIPEQATWSELKSTEIQRLCDKLLRDRHLLNGKTTFKDEFVTCGGVKLKEVDFRTMESRLVPGLYFAGEVLDIDGLTGGFNFQAAWSTGFIAGKSMAESSSALH